ncbi:uncharacterized protein LOC144638743 isoform X3 [Oculina patagonica]
MKFGMTKRKRKMKLSSRRNGTLVPDDDESDSDLQEFSLPKKRIIKPGKSTRRCGCCRVCASVFLSVLLIASVLCVVVLGWFSLRLKRDLDFMRRRLSKVESFDRSTSREYESLNNDLTQKYDSLKTNKEKVIKEDDERYKSILKQIAHLNTTVDDLLKKVKLPGSTSTITKDIESLKKGMADTGGDITEIKDKIKQLTSLASQQNGKVEELSKNLFNLSVQVAQVMGKPTPKPPKNTGTPPLILRLPVNDEKQKLEDKSIMKNVTAQISAEVARVMGIVTSVNHTLSHDVARLRVLMKSLLKEVKKHVATVDELQTKVSQSLKPNHSSVVSRGHLEADNMGVSEQVFNLSAIVTKLTDDVERHSKNLAELMLEVVQINTTVFNYQHQDAIPEKPAPCNCSAEVGNLWEQLSSNKFSIEAVQKDLQALQKPVTTLPKNNTSVVEPTEASISDNKKKTENQSLAESIAAETDKDIEQDELQAENIKPSPSTESNASVSVLEVVKVTEPPVTASPSGHVNSSQPSNTTASPQVTLVDSTVNNQTSSTDQKVQVVKLATPSSEEEIEHNLEAQGND